MRIFLTGISGYLGSVLAKRLAALDEVECITGIDVTAMVVPKPEKVNFVKMDARSPDVKKAIASHDAVIHTAFIVLWKANIPAGVRDDININGTLNVARSALQAGVPHFIHTSSTAAYAPAKARDRTCISEEDPLDDGTSFFYYRNAKAIVEKKLQQVFQDSPTQLTLFRPSFVVGPMNRDTVAAYRKSLVNITGRESRPQYVHEDDVADAFIRSLKTSMPGAFNVVPDDSIDLRQVARLLEMDPLPTLPAWLARSITMLRWRYSGSSVHPSWIDESYPPFEYFFSNDKIKAAGWRPKYNSEAAFRDMLATLDSAPVK